MSKTIDRQSGRSADPAWLLVVVTVATAVLAALAVGGTETLRQDSPRQDTAMPAVPDVFAPTPGAQGLPPIAPDAVQATEHVATF